MENLDAEKLKNDLQNYFGTAMSGPFPMAMMELSEVEKASDEELVKNAEKNRFDLRNYRI